MTSPVLYQWSGEAMIPLRRFDNYVNAEFVVGELYRLAAVDPHSDKSRGHYFASLKEAWDNLPEDIADQWPTVEHLRKFALIKTGYHDSHSVACASRAEALRVAAWAKPMDEFSVVTVHESTVTSYTAKSQKKAAMGAKAFQKSKQDVLAYVWGLVGVDPETGQANAGRAA